MSESAASLRAVASSSSNALGSSAPRSETPPAAVNEQPRASGSVASPGRRRQVPASLELSRSNMASFQQAPAPSSALSSSRTSHTAEPSPIGQPTSPRALQSSHLSADSEDVRLYQHRANQLCKAYASPKSMPAPSRRYTSSSESSRHASPEVAYSPQDRSALVGLGELSTPRWTGHESRWQNYSQRSEVPLPSLVPFESPIAVSRSSMPQSSSLMSLTEMATSPGAATSSSSSSYAKGQTLPSPNPSKSGSAAMTAIDNLLGEFEDDYSEATVESPRQSIARAQESSGSRQHPRGRLPQLPPTPQSAASASTPSKADGMVGLGLDLLRTMQRPRVPSGPRPPSDSSPASLSTPTQKELQQVPHVAARPDFDRRPSTQSSGEISLAFINSPPPAMPSPRNPDKSPRTSMHSKRQSVGNASMRSRSSSLHPHSPAQIAHAISRAAYEEGMDVSSLAGQDTDTAAALRKLDGLASPRAKRRDSAASHHTPHRESISSTSVKRTPSTDSKRRARSKSNVERPGAIALEQDVPALPSPMSTASSPRVSLTAAPKRVRPTSSSGAANDQQRGSISSASMLTGGSQMGTSAASRDSTSFTSFASSAGMIRSNSKGARRGSGGSELSSSGISEASGRRLSSDANGTQPFTGQESAIPPVPPLPKDLDSFSQPGSAIVDSFKQSLEPPTPQSPGKSPSRSVHLPAEASPTPKAVEVASRAELSPAQPGSTSKTPARKWSISNALHMARTPSSSSGQSKTALSATAPNMARKSSADSTSGHSFVGSFTGRKSSSSNDIATLASAKHPKARISHSPSLATIQSTSADKSPREADFDQQQVQQLANIPEHVRKSDTASSGIPFFARRGSSSSQLSARTTSTSASAASPHMPAQTSPESTSKDSKDKSGRKSILGLNFLSRKERKNEEAEASLPASSLTQGQKTTRAAARTSSGAIVPNLASYVDSASSRVRLRNKSMSSATTVVPRRLAPSASNSSLTADDSTSSVKSATPEGGLSGTVGTKPVLTSRASKALDNLRKSPLPPIAGSPSAQGAASAVQSLDKQSIGQTPTRIPRRVGNGSTSPRPSLMSEFGVIDAAEQARVKAATLQIDMDSSSRRTSSSESSRASMPKSRSSTTISTNAAVKGPTPAPRATAAAARQTEQPSSQKPTPVPATKHVKRRSLLGNTLGEDKPVSPITNRTPLRTPRRVSSPANSQSSTVGHARRTSKSITSSAARRESSLVEEANKSLKPPRAAPTITPASASKMSKSTTMPSLQVEERKRRESASASSSRRSTPVDDQEHRADAEMAQYVRRVTSKKLAAGMPSEEIRSMFEFPAASRPTRALTAREASALFARDLCSYEREEIQEYDSVWYVGQGSRKVNASRNNAHNNYGYDDDRGDYNVVMGDHILFRYEITDVLGKGSFGQVLQCRDHHTGEMVAIKIIRNKNRFHKQAVVEIKVLDNLRKWDPDNQHNVIMMTDHFSFRHHLCIVTELLSINLYELIKANSFHGFSTTLIRRFAVQMLNSMTLLRHHRVVHCDLKPENVLLMHPCKSAVKVIDFGSSCFENEKVYTYIQSRFYRSIEVILGSNYHMAIDMWSLGCILAEMFTGMPLFPGENEQEQLACIMEILGLPEKHLIERSSRRKIFFDSTGAPRPVVNSKGRRRRPGSKTLGQAMKCDDELFLDFIAKCLVFDPDRRMKPQAALRHPFIRPEVTRSLSANATPSSRSSRHSSSVSISISTPKRKSATTSTTPSVSSSSANFLSHSTSTSGRVARTNAAAAASLPASVGPHFRYAVNFS